MNKVISHFPLKIRYYFIRVGGACQCLYLTKNLDAKSSAHCGDMGRHGNWWIVAAFLDLS